MTLVPPRRDALPGPPRFRPPASVALEHGWDICEVCERAILDGEKVTWRQAHFHAECAARVAAFLRRAA